MNITQLSLIHVQTCSNIQDQIQPKPTFIQLVQKPEIRLQMVRQCKIKMILYLFILINQCLFNIRKLSTVNSL